VTTTDPRDLSSRADILTRLVPGEGEMVRPDAGRHLAFVRITAGRAGGEPDPLPIAEQHFKAATGMSPMQFQKRLRLQEARRLLLSGERTAALTAEQVGYVSATQFSREYRRAYGVPPAQDAAPLAEPAHRPLTRTATRSWVVRP
jgi:hypothetical protein